MPSKVQNKGNKNEKKSILRSIGDARQVFVTCLHFDLFETIKASKTIRKFKRFQVRYFGS